MGLSQITTPRPPLNLFEAVRGALSDDWTTIYNVPQFRVPAEGPTAEYTVDAAAILTGLVVTNTTSAPLAPVTLDLRILEQDDATAHTLLSGLIVPQNDFKLITLDRQIMKTGEQLQARIGAGTLATFHLSFVLNQREQFTVSA